MRKSNEDNKNHIVANALQSWTCAVGSLCHAFEDNKEPTLCLPSVNGPLDHSEVKDYHLTKMSSVSPIQSTAHLLLLREDQEVLSFSSLCTSAVFPKGKAIATRLMDDRTGMAKCDVNWLSTGHLSRLLTSRPLFIVSTRQREQFTRRADVAVAQLTCHISVASLSCPLLRCSLGDPPFRCLSRIGPFYILKA